MSREERYDTRDRTFSHWHRRTLPDCCTAIDIDFLEYCQRCRGTLGLIELAQDVGQAFKPTIVLEKLALRASVPAYLVFYRSEADSVTYARVQQIAPRRLLAVAMSAQELGAWITKMHTDPCPYCIRWRAEINGG